MRPLILDFKIARSESENPITYQYDPAQSLNVILVDGKRKPFIDLQSRDIELLTKTKAHRENDDDSFLTELGSKTEVARERDDRHDLILELDTKTLKGRERDDRHDGLLELSTKTRVYRKSDDQHFTDYQQD